jgi:hypothetical protein
MYRLLCLAVSFLMSSIVALTISFALIVSGAQAQNGTDSSKEKLGQYAQYIVVRFKLSSANTYRLAYSALRIKQAYNQATALNNNKDEIDKNVRAAMIDADQYASDLAFGDGITEARLKSAQAAYVPDAKALPSSFTQKDFDQTIQKGLEALVQPTSFATQYSDNDLLSTTQRVYSEAAAKDSPLRPYFLEEISKYHNITLDQNSIFDPNVDAAVRYNQLTKYLGDFDPNVASMANNADAKDSIVNSVAIEANSVNVTVTQVVAAANDPSEKSRADKERQIEKSNVTGAFGAASAIATLTGNPDAAKTFTQLEKLSGAIYDIATTDQLFAVAPFAVVNPYLLAAVMVVDLISSPKNNENATMMKELEAIRQEIVELRQLINQRFDRVEFKLDSNFDEIESTLDIMRSDQQVTINQLEALQQRVKKLERADQAAFQSIAKILFLNINAKCFPSGAQPVPPNTLSYCWTAFLYLSDGQFGNVLKVTDPALDAQQALSQNSAVLQHLALEFAKVYSAEKPDGQLLDPVQFLWGVYYLEALRMRNSRWSPHDNEPAVQLPDGGVDTTQIIRSAMQVEDFLQAMAINKKGQLRGDLFNKIFEDYENSVTEIWNGTTAIFNADRIDLRFGGLLKVKWWPTGPNVLDFDDQAPVVTKQQYDQKEFQSALGGEGPTGAISWMGMCPGVQFTQKVGPNEVPLELNTKFRFDPAIFNQLPGVLRWALLDGVMKARLNPCMARATISNVIFGQGDNPKIRKGLGAFAQWHPLTADGDFEVRLSFAYTDANGEHDIALPDLTAHYTLSRGGQYACANDPKGNTIRFAQALWNGGAVVACDGTFIALSGAAQNNGGLKLVTVPTSSEQQDQLQKELNDFGAEYAALGEPTLQKVKQKALSSDALQIEAAAEATATLVYLIRNGIGGSDSNLSALYSWVLDPTNFPNGSSWVNAFLKQEVSQDKIEAEIK